MIQEAPLRGRQVVVTRPEDEAGPLSVRLKELGAEVVHWPVIQFLPPIDDHSLRLALARLSDYDGIVFTSPRAVAAVAEIVKRPPDGLRVASVGEATSAALVEASWRVDLEAVPARSAALVAAWGEQGCRGARILFPASAIARPTIPHGLASHGAQVDQVIAYRTVTTELDRSACLERIESGKVAAVTFASPSAVDGLEQVLGEECFELLMTSVAKVAIGPTTADALERLGYRADAMAASSHLDGLAEAVVNVFASDPPLFRRP